MTKLYDEKKDDVLSYELAIDALREIGVRSGEFETRNVREEIQQEQGPVDPNQLDVIREARSEAA